MTMRADRVLHGCEVAQRCGLIRSFYCALGDRAAAWIIDVPGQGTAAYSTRAAELLLSRLAERAAACE